MHPPGTDTVLVRYGEIAVKGNHQHKQMAQRLQENARAVLAERDLDVPLQREHTRLYAHTSPEHVEAVTDALTDVFGVVSASPAVAVDPTLDAIHDALAAAAREQYDGGSYAVRARRAGPDDAHPFSSVDIERSGGEVVGEAAAAAGVEPSVDLDDPDLTFFVECRQESAFIFLEKRAGPGGLPVGTQAPLVALVSGGLDSPVAAWQAMKRGCPVVPLYVDLGEYGGVDHRARALETIGRLQRYAPNYDLQARVAPGGGGVDLLAAETDTYRMLVLRRFMFRIAEAVAEECGAVGIVTGESIGQKSSQTSTNLRVTSAVTDLPVHRPLLGLDKTEITDRAKAIGTYEDATVDTGCHLLAPDNPATGPPLEQVVAAEPEELDRLAAEAARERTVE
jgi:thiamine biosynthesis protein ThiI